MVLLTFVIYRNSSDCAQRSQIALSMLQFGETFVCCFAGLHVFTSFKKVQYGSITYRHTFSALTPGSGSGAQIGFITTHTTSQFIEGSLEVKLPTIWTVEKQR